MEPFKVTDMPALTIAAQSQLTAIETKYYSVLAGHCRGYTISDANGALEKIRTFATVFYDFFYSFYAQFPDHSQHWRIASEIKALERISVQLEHFTATRDSVNASIVLTVKQTIIAHAKATATPLIKPIPNTPNVPVFANTDSPLLTMAKSIKFPDPVAARRKAFVQPLLDAKGWDVTTWAKKAKVTRPTAKSYLEGKRKTYHANLKALADALGVSFQDFPK